MKPESPSQSKESGAPAGIFWDYQSDNPSRTRVSRVPFQDVIRFGLTVLNARPDYTTGAPLAVADAPNLDFLLNLSELDKRSARKQGMGVPTRGSGPRGRCSRGGGSHRNVLAPTL
jgi:hypothetical protein